MANRHFVILESRTPREFTHVVNVSAAELRRLKEIKEQHPPDTTIEDIDPELWNTLDARSFPVESFLAYF